MIHCRLFAVLLLLFLQRCQICVSVTLDGDVDSDGTSNPVISFWQRRQQQQPNVYEERNGPHFVSGGASDSSWKWPWQKRQPFEPTNSSSTTTSLVLGSSLEELWVDLEEQVQTRADAVESILQDIQQRVETAARELQAGVSRETDRIHQSLQELQLQMDMSARSIERELWESKGGKRIKQELDYIQQTIEYASQHVEKGLQVRLDLLKRTIKRELLRQREGWNRWSRSIRNHLGLIVGSLATFTGGLSPLSRKRALAMECGQYAWMITNRCVRNTAWFTPKTRNNGVGASHLISTSSHPWMQDLASLAVTTILWKDMLVLPSYLEVGLPAATLGYGVFRSVRRILDILQENDTGLQLSPLQRQIALLSSAVTGAILLVMSPIPTPLIAASLAGTKLMIDSVVDEVIGNWFDIMERIGPERLRIPQRLYQALYKRFQRTFLYPVQEALLEIETAFVAGESKVLSLWEWLADKRRLAAIQKTNEENVRQRVKQAVSKCFRLRLSLMIASAGVTFQMAFIHRGLLSSTFHGGEVWS